ncbi:hypothetical protein ACFOUP_03485 [Belliella kenyensis]|uniref:Uncharacterized protein n=1 Tax=Belliella kenyensis TaxID=1472724 RepID=A0ABV8EIG8_9BACT|nr:hypothetical protein [Belliella kenyensis]MCH7402327.1 hypothetical protein [Belliella kenyensis]MDN3603518.1 hypothetical protein [Belliella kenyensis]
MKEAIRIFLIILAIYSGASLILGLYRPVLVLWFMDRFNRMKVIKVYGLALVVLIALILII